MISIAHFPEPYPDELIYSVFCRYYDHSPYAKQANAKADLFKNPKGPLDPEFMNVLTDDAMQMIRKIGLETVLTEHTMLPQYLRFTSGKQKQKILQSSYNGEPLVIPGFHRCYQQSLMYCPMCAAEDRQTYGEAYYHRVHNLRNIGLCPKHRCRLVRTDIGRNLASAERKANSRIAALPVRDIAEITVADYMQQVFEQGLDMCFDSSVKALLMDRMEQCGFVTDSGHVRAEQLRQTLQRLFRSVPAAQTWEYSAVFDTQDPEFYETCLLGLMLGFKPKELCVVKEHSEKRKSIVLPRLETGRPGNKPIDWARADEEYLPIVSEAIDDVRNGRCKFQRPQIAKGAIERYLRLPKGAISMMPKCRVLVETEQTKQ